MRLRCLSAGEHSRKSSSARIPLFSHTDCGYVAPRAVLSLRYVMEDGASAEIAVVGNEGIIGVSLFMGGESTTCRAVVQSAGHACRLTAQHLKDACFHAGPTQRLLLRYTQALLTRMAQTALCNRFDRLPSDLLPCSLTAMQTAVCLPAHRPVGICGVSSLSESNCHLHITMCTGAQYSLVKL
jgi:hypothetical protein